MNLVILLGVCLGFGLGFLVSNESLIGPNAAPRHNSPSGVKSKSAVARSAAGVTESGKILCWIPSRSSVGVAVERILNTWLSRCDSALILVHIDDHDPQEMMNQNPQVAKYIVARNFTNDRGLWNIIHSHWSYVIETFGDEFDWLVKVDDDVFFSPENFKLLVKALDPLESYYLGHVAYHQAIDGIGISSKPFNLGGTYAVSKGAARLLLPLLPSATQQLSLTCRPRRSWAEDIHFAECIERAGIRPSKTLDHWGRQHFIGLEPDLIFWMVRRNDSSSWWWHAQPKEVQSGAHCCSSRPVNWHNLKKHGQMFIIDYLLYHVAVDPEP